MNKKIYKAALIGYYGFGNLGDELLLRASIELLEHSGISRAQIIVLSNKPDETEKNFNVRSLSRWSIKNITGALKMSECLIFGGGGIFQDSTGFKSCLWYWLIVRLAKFLGVRLIAIGQSIGELNYFASRLMTLNAFKLFEFVHVRDKRTYELLRPLKNIRVIIGDDIVFNLADSYIKNEEPVKNQRGKFLLNLRPCGELKNFLDSFSENINAHENITGVALSDDDEEILKSAENKINFSEIVRIKNFDEAYEIFTRAYSAVGMRLHFGILSRIFKTPVALIPYDVKVKLFACDSNIPLIINKWHEPAQAKIIPNDINNALKIAMIEFAHDGQTSN